MTLKEEIKKLEELANPELHNMSIANQEFAIAEASVARQALSIIKKQEEIINMVLNKLEYDSSCNYSNADEILENIKKLLEE